MRLVGKVAIVTGASRGIGNAIAKRFAKEGAKVVINYNHSRSQAAKLLKEVREAGGEAIMVRADVSVPQDVRNLVKKAVKAFGRVDILVKDRKSVV